MRFLGSAVVFSLVLQTVVRMILMYANVNVNTGLTGFQLQLDLKYMYLYVFKCIQICPTCFPSQSGQLEDWQKAKSIYDFTVTDIEGNEVSLEKYR